MASLLLNLLLVLGAEVGTTPEQIKEPTPPPLKVLVNGKYGYVDLNGHIVIEPQFAEAGDFHEGVAWARPDKASYGFIDRTGAYVIPATIQGWPADFHCGRAEVNRDNKRGYINRRGEVAIAVKYHHTFEFESGVAFVGTLSALGKVQLFITREVNTEELVQTYIDRNGVEIGHKKFNADKYINEQLLPVRRGDKWGFVDLAGVLRIPCQFESAERFSEGLAVVCIGEKYGFVDSAGSFVIPPRYDFANSFRTGKAIVWMDVPGGVRLVGFIDNAGKYFVAPSYDDARSFSEGLAAVSDYRSWHWGFINEAGEMVIPPQFDHVSDFKNGVAQVSIDEKIGYVDKRGRYIWAPTK